jgi:hypothetical protein
MRKRKNRDAATRELTPPRGGDFVEDDVSLRESMPDPGSVQNNHATTGFGGDDEHADEADYKVQPRRPT